MIKATGLQVNFGSTRAVDNVSLTVPDSGTVGLLGPNGSGKTTLLRSLYGSQELNAGSIELNGTAVSKLSRTQIAQSVAVVTQERDSELPITVASFVLLGRIPHLGFGSSPNAADRQATAEAMRSVGIGHLASREMTDLSGGERQRALIARALVQAENHVLLDEPTNHLDIRYQHEILNLVNQLPGGKLIVLHDLNLAARYCDRILMLHGGRIEAEGTPEEVLTSEILEPIYGIKIKRLDVDGDIVLHFML